MDHHGFLFLPDRAVIYMCLNQTILKNHYWLSWLMLVWNAGSAAWQQTLYFSCCNITITNSAITWELLGLSLIISFSAFQLENKVEVWLSLHKAYLSRLCRDWKRGCESTNCANLHYNPSSAPICGLENEALAVHTAFIEYLHILMQNIFSYSVSSSKTHEVSNVKVWMRHLYSTFKGGGTPLYLWRSWQPQEENQ